MTSRYNHTHHRRTVSGKRTTAYRFSAVLAVLLVSLLAFSAQALAESYTFNYSFEGSGSITGGVHSETVLGTSGTDSDGAAPGSDLLAAPADCFVSVTATPATGWTWGRWEVRQGGTTLTTYPNATLDCTDAGVGHPVDTDTFDIVAVFTNTAPTANDESDNTSEDTAVVIDVPGNDTDSDGTLDLTTVTVTSGPSNGGTSVDAVSGKVTYTPNADFNGSDSFTYTIKDNGGTVSNTATVSVTVNSAIDIADDTLTTNEDTAGSVNVLSNDNFEDVGASVTATTDGAKGTVTTDGTSVTYTPSADYNGADTFTYTVTAGGVTETASVSVTVNSAVDIADDTLTTNEDTAGSVNVLSNDNFEDVGASVTATTDGAKGTVTTDGTSVTYTPSADYNGADTFTYTVTAGGVTETANVSVTVNSAVDIADDTLTTNEDTAGSVNVLSNDNFEDVGASVTATTDGAKGTVTTDGTSVTYTPSADYNGADTFTYTVTAGGVTETANVIVTVTAVADVADDTLTTNEDTAGNVNVLANDLFVGAATVSAVTQGANGSVIILGGGNVKYTPNSDYNGSDTFTYTVSNGGPDEIATVNVTVTAVADVADDTLTTNEDTAGNVNVLANDLFVGAATVSAVTQGANGSVIILGGGNVKYTPNSDYNGSDTFTYTVSNGGPDEIATVNVTVTAVADVADDTLTTNEDTAGTVNVLTNDLFAGAAMVSAVTQGTNGSVAIGAGGDVTYTPNADYNGADSFTYTVTAGGVTETANVTVTVTAVADVADDTLTTNEDTAGTVNVLTNDLFAGAATVSAVTQGTNGAVVIGAGGDVTYTPNADYNGADSFTYTASNGGSDETATVTVTVTAVADVADDTLTTNEDTAGTVNVLTNDPFAGAATVSAVTQGTNGAVVIGAGGDVTYTPNADYNGADSFTYTASNGGPDETATVTVTVTAVADVADDTLITNEDTAGTVNVLTNDLFAGAATVSAVTQGTNGAVVIGAGGDVTYTPNADYNGADSFTYTASNGGPDETATVNVTVTAVADVADDTLTTNEDTAGTVNVLTNDLFAGAATVSAVTQGTNGAVVIGAGGDVTYTPNADYNGADSFTYTASNGGPDETATVTVTVTAVADVADDTLTTNEDTAGTVNVLTNDLFAGAATVSAVTQGTNGAVVIGAGGDVTYTPNADYNGADSFTYTASNGGPDETATVNVTVTAVADVADDTLTTNEDTAGTVNVLTNDLFAGAATVSAVTQGTNGAVVIGAGGDVTYTPNADYNGADSFTYTASNGGPDETATVNVTVTAVADVADDTLTTNEDTAGTVNVLTNDLFAGAATVSAVTQGTNGAVVIGAGGNVTYTPNADYNGADSFTYTASNGGPDETATVTVTVTAVADVADDTLTTNEDTAGTVNVLTNDLFAGAATVSAVTQGTNGAVVIGAGGDVTYTPNADYNGADSFTYTASNGGPDETATVTVTVTAVADVADDTLTTNEDTAGTVNVLTNDLFAGAATVSAVTQGTNGAVVIGAGGDVTYTPNADYNGADSFTYTASNGGPDETATVTVTVTAVADVADDTLTTNEDTAGTVNVLTNDLFAGAATVSAVTQGTNGAVVIGAGGDVTYTPNADYNGADSFTYTASNGGPDETATVTVTVTAVADVADDTLTTNEDTAGTVNVLTNDLFAGAATVSAVTQGTNGAVVIGAGGNVTYTPNADYNGADSFTYTVSNGGPDETATVNVTVTAVQDANDDNPAAANEDVAQTITVLANDTFSGAHSVSAVTQGANGSVVINAGSTVTYTPNANFNGTDTFTYTVANGGPDETATVTVTITPQGDVVTDAITTLEDAAATINVLANDLFGGAPVLVTALTQPANGTVTNDGGGDVTYTPDADYYNNGAPTDSFTYTATSGGVSETGTVTVTVTEVNDEPSFTPGADQTVLEDAGAQTVAGWATGMSKGPANEAAQTLTFAVTNTNNALFTVQPDVDETTGNLTYTTALNANGSATVSMVLTDDGGTANGGDDTFPMETFTITVTPVNDAPVANFYTTTPTALPISGSEALSIKFFDASYDVDVDGIASWLWDFGDGNTSTEQSPTHIYYSNPTDQTSGVYNVTLTVTDPLGLTGTKTVANAVTVNDTDPTVTFTPTVTSGGEPLTVSFENTSTVNDDGIWSWDLGDGTTSSQPSIKDHVYAQNGSYTVTLSYVENDTDTDSSTNHQTTVITVSDSAPDAQFSVDFASGPEPHDVQFTEFSSGYDKPLTYHWDFGDTNTSTTREPGHTYVQDGSYTVTLTVTDNDGTTDTATTIVTVTDETPVADFGASPTTGSIDLTVNFTDESTISGNDTVTFPTNDKIVSWGWSFGDGDTSTLQNPSHIYTAVGTYNVSLTVVDDDGSTATAFATITAKAAVSDPDDDGDGWTVSQGDCDDTDADINPGKAEICGDGIDQDCYDDDLACPPQGECIDLADKPLDTQLQGDPPNIMLVLDDSGSMDWEVLVDPAYAASTGNKTDDGLYWIGSDEYYYLNEGLDNLWHDSVWPSVNGDNDTTVMRRWLARFYNYNVMYYNPNYEYLSWYGEADADKNFPRAHPMDSSVTMDLNDTLYTVNIAAAGGGAASGSTTILDEEVAVVVDGTWGYDGGSSGAHNGDDKYASGNSNAEIKYTFTPTVTGSYDVSTYTTSSYSYDTKAKYQNSVSPGGGTVEINQDTGGWKTVWTGLSLTAGTPVEVTIERVKNKSTGDYTAADAIKFETGGGAGAATGTANITNAHYHTFNDADSDGVMDVGEAQYLVNFADTDSNNAFDAREFYLYVDDGDDIVEDGELALVAEASVPAALKSRSFDTDLQNFANWFSFYRKRWLTTVAALTQALPEFQGVNLGYRTINGNGVQPVLPVKVSGKTDNTDTILNALKNFRLVRNPASTPLRDGLNKVGLYFHTTATTGSLEASLKTSPLSTDTGGACQQNFAIMFTDGSWNGGATSVPSGMVTSGKNQDGDNGAPYADANPGTLADVAMTWYENDLAPAIADEVPTNFYDKATWQHMVTYGVTFGTYGHLDPDDYDLYNLDPALRVYPTWTDPISTDDEARIDDVYHAAVNGRGQYLSAKNPLELVEKLKEVIRDVISRIGSGSAVTINGEELDTGTVVYQSIYSTDGWTGDVKAYEIDLTTGEVKRDNPNWSAEEELSAQDWDTGRIIATFNGTTGIPFRYTSANDALFNLIDADDAKAAEMVNYLRGDDSMEVRNGTGSYRNRIVTLSDGITTRGSKLGDIVHSSPVFQRYTHGGSYHETLYAGSNDGMLHAFDATTGQEQFAYVPRLVFHNLKELTSVGYNHLYYVDLSPYVANLSVAVTATGNGDGVDNDGGGAVDEAGELEPRTFLVGGLGKGGRGYYALDVTDPKNITSETVLANSVKWEFPGNDIYISSATNATPIVVTTATAHGFSDGDYVSISDVEGNTAANGVWKIADATATTFSLRLDNGNNSTGNGVHTAGTGRITPDPDMGYSFSRGFLVNSSIGYVVIFGNGYNSPARNAVLYVLDAATGTLLKKIDTQHGIRGDGTAANGACNGLSTPQLVDVDADAKVDYAYVGDLNGNMWKFDLTDSSIANWDVAYKTSAGMPKPVFQAKDGSGNTQPITGMADVMRPCEPNLPGYFVVFGTGKYLGASDFSSQLPQTLYGVWDYGDNVDDDEYLGSFERSAASKLSNLSTYSSLLEQKVLTEVVVNGTKLRVLTDNPIVSAVVEDIDNDGVNLDPDNGSANHVGWYFDLPKRKERAVRDVILRSNKAIMISSLPNTSPCSAGGESYLHEVDACTGGRVSKAQLDINADNVIDEKDLIKIKNPDWDGTDPDSEYIFVAPTAIWYPTMVYTPTILGMDETELKLMSTAAGGIVNLIEQGEEKGMFYWRMRED